MIVDAHAHFVPSSLLEQLKAETRLFPSVKAQEEAGGLRLGFCGQEPTRPVMARLSDVAQRKEWLGSRGIDRQVVGGWLDLFGYELPAAEGADWCRFMNEHMLRTAQASGVLAPLGCVPLQDGALAAEVFEEAMTAGFRGVMIGTQPKSVGGNLDDLSLDPFWEAASARQAAVFLHPMIACCDDRLSGHDLVNSVGRIMDTTAALSRLLVSGHLQRFPGVNLLIAHGGAALPYVLGRLQCSHTIQKGKIADPAAGFAQLYFDTVLFDPRALRFLREMAGAERMVLGTDHPFAYGDDWPRKTIEAAGFDAAESQAILGDTAVRLFRIE